MERLDSRGCAAAELPHIPEFPGLLPFPLRGKGGRGMGRPSEAASRLSLIPIGSQESAPYSLFETDVATFRQHFWIVIAIPWVQFWMEVLTDG